MMRYRFIDEVVSLTLDGASRIEVAKTFEPGDDAFTGPAGDARVPDSLLLELMAMAGGHLIFERLGGGRLPLLLKVPVCRFEAEARPGERLRAVATLRGAATVAGGADVAEAEAEVHGASGRVASATLMYLCLTVPGVDLVAHQALA